MALTSSSLIPVLPPYICCITIEIIRHYRKKYDFYVRFVSIEKNQIFIFPIQYINRAHINQYQYYGEGQIG